MIVLISGKKPACKATGQIWPPQNTFGSFSKNEMGVERDDRVTKARSAAQQSITTAISSVRLAPFEAVFGLGLLTEMAGKCFRECY